MNAATFVPLRVAKQTFGVREETLRAWADSGAIPSIRTPGGHRLFGVTKYVARTGPGDTDAPPKDRESICYCHVSSQGQKDDLQRQVQYMSERFPTYRIITDIGSGINFKRKGLRSILELAMQGLVSKVVVAYRDRLCRFAFELVEWMLHVNGVELVVLHESMGDDNAELAEDLLAIVNVFACRVNGRRKYNNPSKDKQPQEVGTSQWPTNAGGTGCSQTPKPQVVCEDGSGVFGRRTTGRWQQSRMTLTFQS
jgi:predicted site-specific integrase-resolvase